MKSSLLSPMEKCGCQLQICENSLIRGGLKLKLDIKKGEKKMVCYGKSLVPPTCLRIALQIDLPVIQRTRLPETASGNFKFKFPPFPAKVSLKEQETGGKCSCFSSVRWGRGHCVPLALPRSKRGKILQLSS